VLTSSKFFKGLRGYIKENQKQLSTWKEAYGFRVVLTNGSEATWQLKAGVLKKQALKATKAELKIRDEVLLALYEGDLLFEELKIQGRIRIEGPATHQKKFLGLLAKFLKTKA